METVTLKIKRIYIPEDEMRQYALCSNIVNDDNRLLRVTQLMRAAKCRTGSICKMIIGEDNYPVRIYNNEKEYILRFGNSIWIYDPKTNTEKFSQQRFTQHLTQTTAFTFKVYANGKLLRIIIAEYKFINDGIKLFKKAWSKEPEFSPYVDSMTVKVFLPDGTLKSFFEM